MRVYDHQLDVSKRLISRCFSQHGMLAWHAGGTGKTLTGLLFISNFPNTQVILILPKISIPFWRFEAEKAGLSAVINRRNVTILTYEATRGHHNLSDWVNATMQSQVKSVILIMDEAHHILNVLKKVSSTQASRILERLGACQKVLLMTATPFMNDDSDIRILINIAAGRNVLEISEAGFREMYYKVSKFHVFTFGWFFSILNSMYHTGATNIAELTNAYEVLTLGESSWNAKELQDAAKADQTGVLGPVVPILTLLAQGLAHLMRILNVNRLFKLNKTKFIKKASTYIDYIPSKVRYENKHLPSIKRRTQTVEYNKYQVDFWVRFMVNKLQNDERKRLGMKSSNKTKNRQSPISSLNDFASIQVDVIDTEVYKNIGRCIGNFHFSNTMGHIVESPKFEMILSIMMETAIARSNNSQLMPQGIVIYSNYFDEGIKLVSEFFQRRGILHNTLTTKQSSKENQKALAMFQQRQISVILLSPEFWESVAIPSVLQLHILEPIDSIAKSDHILSRVVHLNSRPESKFKERRDLPIQIFTWCCTTISLFAKVSRLAREQAKIDSKRLDSVQDLSPDALVLLKYNVASQGAVEIASALADSRSKSTIKETCNVCYDPFPDKSLLECFQSDVGLPVSST